jgi:cyclophilin family peptidyl-prolyl cis-trans isomerase
MSDPAPSPASEQPAAEEQLADTPVAPNTPATDDAPHPASVTHPRLRFETSEGGFVVEIYAEQAPRHVENFQQLVHDGFYDGLTFHRVVPGFVVQAGCPHGDGTGGPGYTLDAEFNDMPHEPGTVSMARTSDPNSAGSQFFVCLDRDNCKHLDGQYTAFGKIVEGFDTIERIAELPLAHPELGMPQNAAMILHAMEVYADEPH